MYIHVSIINISLLLSLSYHAKAQQIISLFHPKVNVNIVLLGIPASYHKSNGRCLSNYEQVCTGARRLDLNDMLVMG